MALLLLLQHICMGDYKVHWVHELSRPLEVVRMHHAILPTYTPEPTLPWASNQLISWYCLWLRSFLKAWEISRNCRSSTSGAAGNWRWPLRAILNSLLAGLFGQSRAFWQAYRALCNFKVLLTLLAREKPGHLIKGGKYNHKAMLSIQIGTDMSDSFVQVLTKTLEGLTNLQKLGIDSTVEVGYILMHSLFYINW